MNYFHLDENEVCLVDGWMDAGGREGTQSVVYTTRGLGGDSRMKGW